MAGRSRSARCCRRRSPDLISPPGGTPVTDPVPSAAIDLILAKRDGRALTGAEIDWLMAAYTASAVADEQMSALLMAIYFRGHAAQVEPLARVDHGRGPGERLDLGGVTAPT